MTLWGKNGECSLTKQLISIVYTVCSVHQVAQAKIAAQNVGAETNY